LVHICSSSEEEINYLVSFFDAGGNHERRPAHVVLDIWVESFLVDKEGDDLGMVERGCPVERNSAIVVFELGELRICLRDFE
jgi:hypothetical protein